MHVNEENVLALAYIGDSVYELEIRKYLLSQNIHKVNKLQKKALEYVTAKNQCKFINYFLDNNFDFFIDNIVKEEIKGSKIELKNEGDFILNDESFKKLIDNIENEKNNK